MMFCSPEYDTSRPAPVADGSRGVACDCFQDSAATAPLEELLSPREHVVQGVLEVRRAFCELAADLLDVLLVALLDLIAEERLQCPIAKPLFPLLRKVRDDVGDEGARESLCLDVGIVGEKRVDRASRRR